MLFENPPTYWGNSPQKITSKYIAAKVKGLASIREYLEGILILAGKKDWLNNTFYLFKILDIHSRISIGFLHIMWILLAKSGNYITHNIVAKCKNYGNLLYFKCFISNYKKPVNGSRNICISSVHRMRV